MSETLKNLLKDYDKKRIDAQMELDDRIKQAYKISPRLEQIDTELHTLGVKVSLEMLNKKNNDLITDLNEQVKKLKNEKNKIIKELNFDLTPHYECNLCNDTGYIMNGYESSMCSCLKQKLFNIEFNKSNIYNLQKQNFDSFKSTYYSDSVNLEKYKVNISPRENIENIKRIAINFINNFDDPNNKNLLFTGNTGLGKTFLSNCIANELIKKGKTVLYQTSPIMLDSIIDYRFNKSNMSFNILENILDVDLLIIDDLGTECMNNMKFTELFNILNSRLLNTKKITKTIISTNLSLQNILNNYDERIVSRIIGEYNCCYFFGDDIRILKQSR